MKRLLRYALLISLFIGMYLLRFYTVRPTFKDGDRVRITGSIGQEPFITGGRQKLVVGQISMFVDRFPEYHYGDRIVAEGVVRKGPTSPRLRGVNWWYLEEAQVQTGPVAGSSRPMSSAVSPAGTRRDPLRPRHPSLSSLHGLRQRILSLYQKYLPEPHSALLSGIVLGTKSSLNPELVEGLRKTGTLHIVVASGTNIAIFAGSTLSILAVILRRQQAVFIAVLITWAYVLLVGLQPPIVRAAVMGTVAFAAQALGREFAAWRALFISGYLLALAQPLWLFDIGFQLSFLATAGIVGLSGRLGRLGILGKLPRGVKETLATTLSAQAAVSPLLAFKFGQISLVSPLVNVFVVPLVPWIMGAGGLAAVAGLVWEPLGQVLAWFVWLPLAYFVEVVKLFSRIA